MRIPPSSSPSVIRPPPSWISPRSAARPPTHPDIAPRGGLERQPHAGLHLEQHLVDTTVLEFQGCQRHRRTFYPEYAGDVRNRGPVGGRRECHSNFSRVRFVVLAQ